jgi:hypothetical protein
VQTNADTERVIENSDSEAPVCKLPEQILLAAHYHLMNNKAFWYERALLEASRILCTQASDLKRERNGGKDV